MASVGYANAQDSIPKTPEKFKLRPTVSLNVWGTGVSKLKTQSPLLNEVEYRFSERSLSGFLPFYNSYTQKDDRTKFFTLLFTGNILTSNPQFSFYESKPNLKKLSVGLRGFHFDGKKGILMWNVNTFFAEDRYVVGKAKWRYMYDLVYNRSVNNRFSYQLGLSYNFRLGGGRFMPTLGVRIGDYTKSFLLIQIPRNISYNIRISKKAYFGLFTRLNGGIYKFVIDKSNQNIFRSGIDGTELVLNRTEWLTGLMINKSFTPNLYFSFNLGVVTNRVVNLNSTRRVSGIGGPNVFRGTGRDIQLEDAGFIGFSFSYYFGKPTYNGTMSPYIELQGMNNNYDAGGNNNSNDATTNDMNVVWPQDLSKKEIKKTLEANYSDIQEYLED